MNNISALIGGFIFGFGLVLSGMADPDNVLAFLTLNANWNPALILVMGAAVTVTTIGYNLVQRTGSPLYASAFNLPTKTIIDPRLIGGAFLVGVMLFELYEWQLTTATAQGADG